jgi:hypothetical protein
VVPLILIVKLKSAGLDFVPNKNQKPEITNETMGPS